MKRDKNEGERISEERIKEAIERAVKKLIFNKAEYHLQPFPNTTFPHQNFLPSQDTLAAKTAELVEQGEQFKRSIYQNPMDQLLRDSKISRELTSIYKASSSLKVELRTQLQDVSQSGAKGFVMHGK